MTRTKFQAVTDRRDRKGRPFIRTSQSHNAAKPFTHAVLVERTFADDRGVAWWAENWCGSALLAEKAAEQNRRYIGNGYSLITDVEIVPVEIVGTVGKPTSTAPADQSPYAHPSGVGLLRNPNPVFGK